jgi:hypothetical protein
LIQPERRMPRAMAIHSGDVCTMCRRTPCDTAPTTSKAAIMETQQTVKMRKSRSRSHLTGPSFSSVSRTFRNITR